MDIPVDDDVKQMIIDSKQDYRICTACTGPALVPVSVKAPKENDIKIPIGDQILYVSRVQAPYIRHICMEMLYDEDEIDYCPAFYSYTRKKMYGE